MELGLAWGPVTDAVAAWYALLNARICGATAEMVPPQKFGCTSTPVAVLTIVPAPAIVLPTCDGLKGVGHGNAAATPPEQTSGVERKVPCFKRAGLSKRILFQMEFSKNKPAPPRTTVFPFPLASQAKPNCGAKFRPGLRT